MAMKDPKVRLGRRSSNHGAVIGTIGAGLLLTSVGCNSFDPVVPEETDGFRVVIPTDVRRPTSAVNKPPAVTGGTVLVTRNGATAVVSDAEQNRMVLVSMAGTAVSGFIALSPGDEPGRLIEDDAGRVHVVLRRGGAIATIDPMSATLVDRRPVCAAPRGLTLSAPDTLTVACADGKLVTMPASGGVPTRVVTLDTDLRDVMVVGDGLVVSRFKSAELLRVGGDGTLLRRDRPTSVMGQRIVPIQNQGPEMFGAMESVSNPFRPVVAWRTLPRKDGSVIVVHQRAVDAEVEVSTTPGAGVSSYGGGASCSGISQNAVTVMNANGVATNLTIGGPPLPVDATLLADDHTLIVAHAGQPDPVAARPFVVFEGDDAGGMASAGGAPFGAVTLSMIDVPSAPVGAEPPAEGTVADDPGCFSFQGVSLDTPVVAIAANPASPTELVLQTRQPSTIKIVRVGEWNNARVVSFDDGTTIDTGYALFHRDSGGGIACASCHPEGAEDGNVWRFSDSGERKTQSLQANLAASAPFHWDGKLPNVDAIMSQVFVARMGGIYQSPERLAVLRDWLFSQTAPAPMRASDDPAVVRGRDLFEATGCTDCHVGTGLTNNRNADVGTGETLQVPSLIGVGYRAPYMHNGCAKTLTDRFDPSCGGGDAHGRMRGIDSAGIADLVAYLESL